MDAFAAITPFPASGGVTRLSDACALDVELHKCCKARASAGDGFAHCMSHHIGDVKGDLEEVVRLTVDSLLKSTVGAARKFAERRRAFTKEYPTVSQFLTPLQLKKAVAAGQDLLDPIGVQAVASALNKHVGIVFKGEMWSMREDANFWSCDIQLAAVQEASGKLRCMPVKMLRRSARMLGTVSLVKDEIKIEVDPVEEPVLTSRQCQRTHDYAQELLCHGPRYPPQLQQWADHLLMRMRKSLPFWKAHLHWRRVMARVHRLRRHLSG